MPECPRCQKTFDPVPTSGDFCPDCADVIRDEFGLSPVLQGAWIRGVRPALTRTRTVLKFAFHQFIGTWGVGITTPFLVAFGFDFLRLFGRSYPMRNMYWISTETGFFPVQIGFALFLGWLLGRDPRRSLMLWVWVLPFMIACYAVAAVPTVLPAVVPAAAQAGVGESRFWHYFGTGCRLERRCIDQIMVIMPFYAAAAYSIGALEAPRMPEDSRRASTIRFWGALAVGLIFLAGTTSLLVELSRPAGQLLLRQSLPDGLWPWRWIALPLFLLPAVVGVCLIDIGFSTRRKQEANASAGTV